jgi:hypothetical protein
LSFTESERAVNIPDRQEQRANETNPTDGLLGVKVDLVDRALVARQAVEQLLCAHIPNVDVAGEQKSVLLMEEDDRL